MHGRWSRLLSHSVEKSLWSNEICPEHININNSVCLGKSREEAYHLTRNILSFGLSILSLHYNNVIMGATASKMTGASIVCLTVCSGQIKKTSKLRVAGHCEGSPPADSPHKGPVTRKMLPFDDVIAKVPFSTRVLLVMATGNTNWGLGNLIESEVCKGQNYYTFRLKQHIRQVKSGTTNNV